MKKRLMTVSMLTAAAIGLAACGSGGGVQESSQSTEAEATQEGSEEAQEEETQQEEVQQAHAVTFYDSDGTTVLQTVEVEDGALLEEYVPEKDGYTFAGWFATPQMSHRFDFATALRRTLLYLQGLYLMWKIQGLLRF